MVAEKRSEKKLTELLGECQRLGAEIRLCPEHRYFTAMVWRGWDTPDPQNKAKEIQVQIRSLAKQYPHVVCYCFDDFSTLVYAI